MRSCRDVAMLVSQSLDRRLSFHERVALRFHVFLCKACGRYRRQLRQLDTAVRLGAAVFDAPVCRNSVDDELSVGRRARIRRLLMKPR